MQTYRSLHFSSCLKKREKLGVVMLFVISVPIVFKVRSSRSVSVHSKFKDSLDPVSKLEEKRKAEKSG